MLRFEAFVGTFSFMSMLKNSRTARYVYDNILGASSVRLRMALASEFGIPALAVCAKEIEEICERVGSDLDLNNRTVKQSIGRMVKESLRELGYEPASNGNRLPAGLNLKYFQTATAYQRNETARPVILIEMRLTGAATYTEVLNG